MESSKRIGSLPVRETPINSTYFIKFWSSAKSLSGSISYDITRIYLTLIDCNTTDKQGNAVCIARNSINSCWLLGDFSNQIEKF